MSYEDSTHSIVIRIAGNDLGKTMAEFLQNIYLYIIILMKLTIRLLIVVSNVTPIVLKNMARPCTRYNIMW
jgi:hypothetical protein